MTLIIAEAGVNHNGDLNLALELINQAKLAGVDVVKFQTFKAINLVTAKAKKAKYQTQNTQQDDSQLAMLSKLELSESDFLKLNEYCEQQGIEFLSTAFDKQSLDFLVDTIGIKRLKIPSGELTNLPFVLDHAKTGLNIILSTGMATLADIELALSVLAFGYTQGNSSMPSLEGFQQAYGSAAGQQALSEKVTVLHCTTEYPAPFNEINLNSMQTLQHSFKVKVGYSDHSLGIVIPIAAVANGAEVIEKHFTLDKNMDGPDHKASLEPHELANMVSGIRQVEQAMGSGIKFPYPSEIRNRVAARKSLVAACDIKKGDVFNEDNITIKRPGDGISPLRYWDILGEKSAHQYCAGDLISE